MSLDVSGWSAVSRALPQAKPSNERVGVVACSTTLRQLFQFLDVASSENYVVGLKGGDQLGHHVLDILSPFLFPVLL
jgi:hypothetical protein